MSDHQRSLRLLLLQLPMAVSCKREGPEEEAVRFRTSSFFTLQGGELVVNRETISFLRPFPLAITNGCLLPQAATQYACERCKREGPKEEAVSFRTMSFYALQHEELVMNRETISFLSPSACRPTLATLVGE